MKQIFVISPWRDVDRSAYESTQLLLSSTLVGSKLNKMKAIRYRICLFPLLPLTKILCFIIVIEKSNRFSQ